jgi:hypothetical protein
MKQQWKFSTRIHLDKQTYFGFMRMDDSHSQIMALSHYSPGGTEEKETSDFWTKEPILEPSKCE